MSAELMVDIFDVLYVRVAEQRVDAGRPNHIGQHDMLSRDEVDVLGEALGDDRIVQTRQENQQRPAAEVQADEREYLRVGLLLADEHQAETLPLGTQVECLDRTLRKNDFSDSLLAKLQLPQGISTVPTLPTNCSY